MWEVALLSRTYCIFGEYGKLESLESAIYWCYGTWLLHWTLRGSMIDISHATTMTRYDADESSEATKFVKAHRASPLSHCIWTGKQKSKYLPPLTPHDNQSSQKKASKEQPATNLSLRSRHILYQHQLSQDGILVKAIEIGTNFVVFLQRKWLG